MTTIDDILAECRKTLPSPFHTTAPILLSHVMEAADRINEAEGIAPDYGAVLEAARLLFIECGVCDPALPAATDEAGPGAPVPPANSITGSETEALIQVWRDRAQTQGYVKGHKRYADMEVEFFVGAMAMLAASGRSHPPFWYVLIMSGRSLADTLCPSARPQWRAHDPAP